MDIKKISKKQLAEIVACYEKVFPGWELVAGERLLRRSGPVLQQIGFEALRSGAYRPSAAIRVLIAPGILLLPQFLDIRHREISPREHERKWEQVVAAIEQQILPSVRAPLRIEDIIELTTKNLAGSTNDMCGLAALHAYVGNDNEALVWCQRVVSKLQLSDHELKEWELAHLEYVKKLSNAINSGKTEAYWQEQSMGST